MPEPYLIGMAINLAGSVLINVGTNAIKYHHVRNSNFHRLSSTSQNNSTRTGSGSSSRSNISVSRVGRCESNRCLSFCFCKSCVAASSESRSNSEQAQYPSSASTSSSSSSSSIWCCLKRATSHPPPPSVSAVPSSSQSFDAPPASSLSPASTSHVPPSSSSSTGGGVCLSVCDGWCSDKSMYWWVGFILFFVGNVMNFISFGFAAQSLLAGLGSVQFISNVVCSVLFMNQRFTTRIFCSTLLIITGNLLIVVFASHDSQKLSVNELWDNFHYSAYRIYMTILLFSVVVLYIFYKEAKKRMRASLLAGERPSVLLSRLLPCAYAAISGIIGTQSVLLAKSCSELVRTTIAGENQFIYPFTYVVLVAWVASMVFWLYRMNAALRKFDGVFIIPVLQVVWTLFSIVGGGIYFREFDNFDSVTIGLFTLGVLVVIFGVYLLAPQSSASSNRQQLSSLDHSSDIELITHHPPNNVNYPHHNLRRYIANSSSSPLHHTVYSDVSSTNSPAIGPSPNHPAGLTSSASAASLASQSIALGQSSFSGSHYHPNPTTPHHHHHHHHYHGVASLSSPSSSNSLSLSGSGSHPSATSHLLHVERHRSSGGNASSAHNLNVGWSRLAPSRYPNPLRSFNAYDDLDVLETPPSYPNTSITNSPQLHQSPASRTPAAPLTVVADAPIEVLLRQGSSASASSLSLEHESSSSIHREVLVVDPSSRSADSSHSFHRGFEHDDSFAITLSPAPHSMPVTPIHTSLTLGRELEKRSRGMSLGFSMPMIDLENEDL